MQTEGQGPGIVSANQAQVEVWRCLTWIWACSSWTTWRRGFGSSGGWSTAISWANAWSFRAKQWESHQWQLWRSSTCSAKSWWWFGWTGCLWVAACGIKDFWCPEAWPYCPSQPRCVARAGTSSLHSALELLLDNVLNGKLTFVCVCLWFSVAL